MHFQPQPKTTKEKILDAAKNCYNRVVDVAWIVGVSAIIIAYPIAISVLDDRFIMSKMRQQ